MRTVLLFGFLILFNYLSSLPKLNSIYHFNAHVQKKATIHQVTTMLATSKNVIFAGHNHLQTTGADDPSLAGPLVITPVSGHQHRWLAGGYDLQI